MLGGLDRMMKISDRCGTVELKQRMDFFFLVATRTRENTEGIRVIGNIALHIHQLTDNPRHRGMESLLGQNEVSWSWREGDATRLH